MGNANTVELEVTANGTEENKTNADATAPDNDTTVQKVCEDNCLSSCFPYVSLPPIHLKL